MPIVASGVYVETGEKAYEAESSYYLNFQITSALVSIEYLIAEKQKEYSLFENNAQYYHYYTDHLLYSLGQISTRFIFTKNDSALEKTRKESNKRNFDFTEEKFPILSNKTARNTIEHIDEYDNQTIKKYKGVGGFNLIDANTEPKLVNYLREHRSTHIYTLDLVEGFLLIFRKGEEINISIEELKTELLELKRNVKHFQKTVNDIFE